LILKDREAQRTADMMNSTLFVERCYRLGSRSFSNACGNSRYRQACPLSSKHLRYEVAALVSFGNDPVGLPVIEHFHDPASPFVDGRACCGFDCCVVEDVGVAGTRIDPARFGLVWTDAGDDDAGFVCVLA
jgi:hypothetical protein